MQKRLIKVTLASATINIIDDIFNNSITFVAYATIILQHTIFYVNQKYIPITYEQKFYHQ